MFGDIDDCEPNECGDDNCVNKVNCYTCNCDAGHELMLQENDLVCVAKECGTFSLSRMLQWSRRRSGSWCEDLSPSIHTVRLCEVRRRRRFSRGVSPSEFTKLQCAS